MKRNSPKNKNATTLVVYLSRVGDKLFVAVDGNTVDLTDFGIDAQKFHDLGIEIDKVLQNALGINK